MKSILRVVVCLSLLLGMSCKSTIKQDAAINPNWHKLSLPDGWVIYAPLNFTCVIGQGVDSEPGYIISKKDSIVLGFDSGSHERQEKNCNFQDQYRKAKGFTDSNMYKSYHKTPFKAIIDTINDRIAVVTIPAVTGTGAVHVEIFGCQHSPWLAITSGNLSAKKQQLVLQMYKTIRQSNPEQ